MSNWKLHKDKYVKATVTLQMDDFIELDCKAELTRQIEKLPKETQHIVYNILERYLNDLEG